MRLSDVYPRDDDDDKTWRGDEAWRANTGRLKLKEGQVFLLCRSRKRYNLQAPIKLGFITLNNLILYKCNKLT